MVNQAVIQSKVARGFTKAAKAIGSTCQWYRPIGSGNPLARANGLGTLSVLIDTNPDMMQRAPSQPDTPDTWFGAFDLTTVRNGDFIVDPTLGTFYVATVEFFRPARLVQCNRVLTFTRPGSPAAGADFYGGARDGAERTLASEWPASVLTGTKGERGDTDLPSDPRLPWVSILVANIPGVQFRPADYATTEDQQQSMTYLISSAIQTSQGWRLSAQTVVT